MTEKLDHETLKEAAPQMYEALEWACEKRMSEWLCSEDVCGDCPINKALKKAMGE